MNRTLPRPFPPILQLLTICLLLLPVSAMQAADSLELGNQAYMRKDYEAAITYYRQAAKERGFSASLLYNLGNSYARAVKTGPAVLAYEQALRLAPTDPDIRANLESVRKANGLYEPNQ
ncbi:MAG TPA: tetratricopeptide repeat protein, partial [Desulfobulbaceae bacterium]|nr:tetratricopeptide repeat protein [Desulfobulbaceae bacterium]